MHVATAECVPALLEEMKRQRDEARDAHDIAVSDVIAAQTRAAHAEARCASAERRIQALEAALGPFAEMATTYEQEQYSARTRGIQAHHSGRSRTSRRADLIRSRHGLIEDRSPLSADYRGIDGSGGGS